MPNFGNPIIPSPNMLPAVADTFVNGVQYDVGDYAWYNGKLYRFTAAHNGAWTGNDVEAVKLSAVVGQLQKDVSSATGDMLELGADLEFDSETSMLYLLNSDGERISDGIVISGGGGGGGGGGNNAVLTVTNTTGWLSKTISLGAPCVLSFDWSSLEDEIPTGDGVMTVRVGGVVKRVQDVAQGAVSIDVGSFLATGSNKVRVSISDVYENTKSINFTIAAVVLTINSTFDTSGTFPAGETVTYTYTPVGNVEKIVHFIVDGTEVGTQTVTVSGRQQSFTLPAMNHNAHSLLVYFLATIDGEEVESNELYYSMIVVDPESHVPIISSTFTRDTAEQYETIVIPYRVYSPDTITSAISLYVGETKITDLTVDRTEQTWSYRFNDMGDYALSIVCGSVMRVFSIDVTESSIDVEPVTQDLALFLTSAGRSNSELNPGVWEDEDNHISCTMTGFNFVSDGWVQDADGVTVLRVSGDARVTIPYKAFATDFRSGGKTIELEFATRNVLDYDASVISCMSGGRGFQLTAQRASMKSEQSEIYTQYKEDEHVRISFVVDKRAEDRLLLIYINGIMSGVIQYPDDDDFSQATPVNISIGSNDCVTDVYNIRIYNNNLTRHQILENWIADTQSIDLMLERYQHNSVYDEYGRITIDHLPSDLPYMVISCAELPQYKGDKKTVSGYYIDPQNGANSFNFSDAQADVQGTSSQYYPRKNYKIKFNGGFQMLSSGETVSKYKMRPTSIATKTFTFKADVASSEGANNVELARLYNDASIYRTPPQTTNPSIRQGIDGFPIVIFWDDGESISFIGKYNFNNDKGTEEVFGFAEGDESWEILNNTSSRVLWQSDDFSGDDWLNDFEGRYPDGNTDSTNLAALSSWLVSTDQSQATGNALPAPYVDVDGNTHNVDNAAYRLAKFKTELEDHLDKDSAMFYYLFTELFLMVDSRAKNAFPTFYDDDPWCWLPYDFDTAIGTNNEGALVFSYNLEDTDTLPGGAKVFNGQDSVMWVNLRQAFHDDLQEMYRTLRSTGAVSYSKVEQAFEEHQSKWPEAIFNEDSWFKYIDPLLDDGTASYLSMAQGSKAEQRKWWLYNRFRYIDSKYNAGDALSDLIQVRGYAKADITVTPYADIYPTVKYGSYLVSERGERNVPTTLINPLTTVNDTEIYIYSASQLASVGDLSGLKVGFADFSMATKLQSIKVGDSNALYENPNLTELYVGNNPLLNTVDARNCSGLTQAVDLSGAANIEYVYFSGTNITSCSLPNGGILKTLVLPSSVANLTVRNQPAMTTFMMDDYSNITTLRVENTPNIPVWDIIGDIAANSRVRIIGFTMTVSTTTEVEDFYDYLDEYASTMRGLDENGNTLPNAVISGTITGLDSITGAWLAAMNARYPDITITYEHITSNLYYYTWNGATLLHTEAISDGGDGTWNGTPSRESDAQYSYTFAGWSRLTDQHAADPTATKNVSADRSVYAAYSTTVRTYTVYFYNGGTLLQTVNNVPYGGTATYSGPTPIYYQDPDNYAFVGFNPDGTNIQGITYCYAVFRYAGIWTRKLLDRTISGSYENSDVEYVGAYAFANCRYVSSVEFPTCSEIGMSAFYSCTVLTSVSFPECTSIGNNAFDYCQSLTTAVFPECISIGSAAFRSCARLSSVNTPKCVTIGNDAFQGCVTLTTVSFPKCTTIGSSAFAYLRISSASFPECTTIGSYAFGSCNSLTTAVFPECTTIGGNAFYSCQSLTTTSFPECTTIGNDAFYNCKSLTTASFPKCTSIGGRAFYNCYSLTTISFPECTTIELNAFGNCSSLTVASFSKCASISQGAFQNCSSLSVLSFPQLTAISNYTFQACPALTEVYFPECTSIGESAFRNCTALTTASFPKCVSLRNQVFSGCVNLVSLYLMNSSVCSLTSTGAFTSTPIGGYSAIAGRYGSIYVPTSLLTTYKSAQYWSSFSSRFVGI